MFAEIIEVEANETCNIGEGAGIQQLGRDEEVWAAIHEDFDTDFSILQSAVFDEETTLLSSLPLSSLT